MAKGLTRLIAGRRIVAIAAAVAVIAPALAAPKLVLPQIQGEAPAEDPAVLLAGQMRAELVNVARDASVEDVEASLVFVISQRDYQMPVVSMALEQLRGAKDLPVNLAQAITNVRLALLRNKARGTGAINSNFMTGGGSITGGAVFSPVFGPGGGGGGGSDYSS